MDDLGLFFMLDTRRAVLYFLVAKEVEHCSTVFTKSHKSICLQPGVEVGIFLGLKTSVNQLIFAAPSSKIIAKISAPVIFLVKVF